MKIKLGFTFSLDNTKIVKDGLDKAVERILNKIGDSAINYIKKNAPVDTGALRDSYVKDVDVKNQKVTVGSPLEYAPYVELGTGPNYEHPPAWVINNAKRGHHLTDPWMYLDDDGEWKVGWFVRSQPHLRPAFWDNLGEYRDIMEKTLKNWRKS